MALVKNTPSLSMLNEGAILYNICCLMPGGIEILWQIFVKPAIRLSPGD
ncbi:hypothetical protein [Mixta mediterraneensis]|nr:hypothetical protein [Mixta mediterraneensis]